MKYLHWAWPGSAAVQRPEASSQHSAQGRPEIMCLGVKLRTELLSSTKTIMSTFPTIILIPSPITAALPPSLGFHLIILPFITLLESDSSAAHLCSKTSVLRVLRRGWGFGGVGMETAVHWPSAYSRWAEQIKYSKLGSDFTAAKSRLYFSGCGRVCLINSLTQDNERTRPAEVSWQLIDPRRGSRTVWLMSVNMCSTQGLMEWVSAQLFSSYIHSYDFCFVCFHIYCRLYFLSENSHGPAVVSIDGCFPGWKNSWDWHSAYH